MIIKNKFKNKKKYSFNFFKFYFYFTSVFFFFFLIFFFNTGYWKQIKNPFIERLYNSSVNNYYYIPTIVYSMLKGISEPIPELNIQINFKNLMKLEEDRNNALKFEDATEYEFLEVPIKLKYKTNSLSGKIRLKGDRKIHFNEKNRYSYKINLKKQNVIFGLEEFSLMKPRARNYAHEWIFHKLNAKGGLITLKYEFIKLKINGEDHGLYVLEESFDKVLIERNERRNSIIVGIIEEFDAGISNSKLQFYNKKSWQENSDYLNSNLQKIRKIFDNDDKLTEYIDQEKWAWYFAVVDLGNFYHGLAGKSVKFYVNPLSGKVEPIGFDGHRNLINYEKKNPTWSNLLKKYGPTSFDLAEKCQISKKDKQCEPLVNNFFFKKDGSLRKNFYRKYVEAINLISSDNFFDNFFKKNSDQLNLINSKIYMDYFYVDHIFFYGPGIYYFKIEDYIYKKKFLQNRFNFKESKIFIEKENNVIKISNNNINNFFKIRKINCYDFKENKFQISKNNLGQNLIDLNFSNKDNIIILENRNISYNCESVEVIDTEKKVRVIDINNKFFVLKENSKRGKKFNNSYLKYFNNPSDGSKLYLKDDYKEINEDLFIPPNYEVIINQDLIITNNAFIISDSPWIVKGLNEKKIQISGKEKNFGGGILIRNSKKKSYFENVDFAYLNGNYSKSNYSDLILMGSVNFYNTKLSVQKAFFKRISSEDALNVVNSNFDFNDLHFQDIASDAVDFDFSKGNAKNLVFSRIGNDGVDFSGSTSEISNLNFDQIGDKMISIGENSNITIDNVQGNNGFVGIAVKDGSSTRLENININNSVIGLATYIKKPEYEFPTTDLNKFKFKKVKENFISDKNSKIVFQNKENNLILSISNDKIIDLIYKRDLRYIN